MDKRMIEDIRQNLASKSTDDLLRIWKENDRERWSDAAFEAVRQILTERGLELPAQDTPTTGTQPAAPPPRKASRGFLVWGAFLAVGFFFSRQGQHALSSGSLTVIFVSLLGLALSLGICIFWYFLSGRRKRRGVLARGIGSAFFVIGSTSPIIIFMDAVAGPWGGKPLGLGILLPGILTSLAFLTGAYFLHFRTRGSSAEHMATDTDGLQHPST